jgi:hypothetical protein
MGEDLKALEHKIYFHGECCCEFKGARVHKNILNFE